MRCCVAEPMFVIFPHSVQSHGLAALFADHFAIWREEATELTAEIRRQISDADYFDVLANTMNQPSSHRSATLVYDAQEALGRGLHQKGWRSS